MAVGAIVMLLVTVGVVLPLFSVAEDQAAQTLTIHNTGAYFTTPDDDNHTITLSADNITIDAATVDYPEGYGGSSTLIAGPDWIVRYTSVGTVYVGGPPQQYTLLGNVNDNDIVLTVSGSTLTATTTGGVEVTYNNMAFRISDAGDYVMCANPYIKSDTAIFGGIRTQGTNSNGAAYDLFQVVSGNIDNGFNSELCRAAIPTASPTLGTITSTFSTSTETVASDLFKLNAITQSVEFWDNSTATVSISYVIVPETITYTNDNYDATQETIISILPVLIIVGVMLLVVGAFINNRRA